MKTITEYTEKLKSFFLPSREIAPVEDANVSSAKYSVGEQFIKDSQLCRAKTAISKGDTFVLNSNYELSGDVSSQIQALANDKQDKTLSSAVTIDGVSKTTVESAISGIAPVVDKVSKSANEYNTSTSYKNGDYCTHDGKLYRCNTACSGAWVSSYWTEDTLTNAVNQLNNPFNILSNSSYSHLQSKGVRAIDNTEVTETITLTRDSIVLGIAVGPSNHNIYYGNPTPNHILVYPGLGETAISMRVLAAGTKIKLSAMVKDSTAYVSALPLEDIFKTLH